jgi:hypothetical protein
LSVQAIPSPQEGKNLPQRFVDPNPIHVRPEFRTVVRSAFLAPEINLLDPIV